jgi:hypothetical protein
MSKKIFGTIRNASAGGAPVKGLRVQAWDEDWPDGDDFMGRAYTNALGQFNISYQAGHWDESIFGLSNWLPDIFITVDVKNAANKWVHLGKSQVFKDHPLGQDLRVDLDVNIQDLVTNKTDFNPEEDGFQFYNYFKLEPDILGIDLGTWEMGFCGGMCAAALNRFTKDEDIPKDEEIPEEGSSLFNELLFRQIRSTPLDLLPTLYDWQSAPDVSAMWRKPSIGQRTKREWPKLKSALDRGQPTTIILIRARGYFGNPTKNHQVLAIGYKFDPSKKDLEIQVYDPNKPKETHTLSMNLGLPDGKLYFKDSSGSRTRGFLVNPAGKGASV